MNKRRSTRPALRAIAGILLLAAVLWPGASPGADSAGTDRLVAELPPQAAGLESFFQALHALETGARTDPVAIIQIGDSHTAGGWFTARLRKLFQDRFGAAGRGMMPAGKPFRYYRPGQVEVEQSDEGWTVDGSLRSTAEGPFGITGFRLTGESEGATISLTSSDPEGFDRVELELIDQSGGGGFVVSIDGQAIREISTASDIFQARRVVIEAEPGSRELEIRLKGDGPVQFLSWTVDRATPGVVFDSHGIVGATIDVISHWDEKIVAWELNHRKPSLIFVEYGGNEGFNDRLDLEAYEIRFDGYLNFLRQCAPAASIVVLGASDGARLPRYCLGEGEDGLDWDCRPLTPEEAENYHDLIDDADPELCRWHAPPNLGAVREIQRDICRESGVPFWDWSALMNGECGIHEWVVNEPQLAARDHLHLQVRGYDLSADELFEVIMDYYQRYLDDASDSANG